VTRTYLYGREKLEQSTKRQRRRLLLTFEDDSLRQVDLAPHLNGEVFDPLKDLSNFKSVHLNSDLDTIVCKNGADMSPDFLYERLLYFIQPSLAHSPRLAPGTLSFGL
jgi:Protein of unknown function (DUF2442)